MISLCWRRWLGLILAWSCVGLGPMLAQDQQGPENPPTVAKPSTLENRVDDVARELTQVQRQNEQMSQLLKKLSDQVDRLSTDLTLQLQVNTSEVKMLKNRLEQIEKDLARLQIEQQNQRRAFAFNPPAAPAQPLPMGQIQILNEYPTMMYVFVDGVSYAIPPYTNRMISRAAGTFSYEVYGVQGSVLRTLAAGETFTIRIR